LSSTGQDNCRLIVGSFGIYQHDTDYAESPCPRLLETATHLAGIAIERKQVEAALRESDHRKDAFLATLSHELRNPLASIRNAVQLLQHSVPSDHPAARPTAILERQVNQMVRLVDDLLEVSRINRDKVKLNLERVELSSIVQQAVEATSTLVQCMNHELKIALPAEPIYLRADPCRLSQILANLLDNACKYTGDGGHICLSAESGADEAIIRVRDTGVGIERDQFQAIFDMFTQLDSSLIRAQSGLGIGLTLVKSLVQLHGGTVEVQSAGRNQGTEFIVRLPLTADKASVANPINPVATAVHRILIIDDDPDAADTLSMLLELSGHETQTLNESTEAVATAEAFVPDLILLDIGMPKMDGYSVARSIRQQAWGDKPVLVALTGWGQEEDRRKSREAGFDGHLVKPADYVTLSQLIADLNGAKQNHGRSLT
jgi:signal transduction histidine kinase/ActR/RegA family two-component response regulator